MHELDGCDAQESVEPASRCRGDAHCVGVRIHRRGRIGFWYSRCPRRAHFGGAWPRSRQVDRLLPHHGRNTKYLWSGGYACVVRLLDCGGLRTDRRAVLPNHRAKGADTHPGVYPRRAFPRCVGAGAVQRLQEERRLHPAVFSRMRRAQLRPDVGPKPAVRIRLPHRRTRRFRHNDASDLLQGTAVSLRAGQHHSHRGPHTSSDTPRPPQPPPQGRLQAQNGRQGLQQRCRQPEAQPHDHRQRRRGLL
mmetsp:Transcript_33955/g.97821  ORF Transcript_33955/g.97821 Transcript_33955/m.97821 type:complete len:248 (-) Transcript_33955:1040-1783(-)